MKEFAALADAEGESPFAPPQTPRLSILHLMLWTFCTAVYLSFIRARSAMQRDFSSDFAALQQASGVIQGIVIGATLAGAIVLVATRVRFGPPMLRQPGHWLLFVAAISNLVYVPFVFLLLLQQRSPVNRTWLLVSFAILYVVAPIAYSFAACRSGTLGWRLIFIGLAIIGLSQCLVYLGFGFAASGFSWFRVLYYIPSLGSLLLAGAILVAVVMDAVAGEHRDWLHWTGVVTHLGTSSLTLLWMIGAWLIRL